MIELLVFFFCFGREKCLQNKWKKGSMAMLCVAGGEQKKGGKKEERKYI